jgi:CheY-like chemotaxis protein
MNDPLGMPQFAKGFDSRGCQISSVPIKIEKDCASPENLDLLFLEPLLGYWEWLEVLLEVRKNSPNTTIILYVQDSGMTGDFIELTREPGIFLLQSLDHFALNLNQLGNLKSDIPKRVLFVDDDPNVLLAYRRLLRNTPWNIEVVDNAREAIQWIEQESFDLVVTDIKMPGIHGFELVSKIRKHDQTIPVMVCSGYESMRDEAELQLLNIAAFIEKPVKIIELEARIRALIGD